LFSEKGVGFTKPIHQVAKMLNVTPPLQYPRIVEEQGKAASPSLPQPPWRRWPAPLPARR
jgi:hypothetical protein